MKQIVVFDFDCTLTKEHLWRNLYEYKKHRKHYRLFHSETDEAKEWIRTFIFGGEIRLDKIKQFLTLLLSFQNTDIAISSHGNLDDILKALRYADIDKNLFKYIHGREQLYIKDFDITTNFNFEKHHFIDSFLYKVEKYNHILFIDDDEPHGSGQYYNTLSNNENITSILMHNVKIDNNAECYVDEKCDKGINEVDQQNILMKLK